MADEIKLENILFIDIETVSIKSEYEELDDRMKMLWSKKAKTINGYETDPAGAYKYKAGIFAEFSKVICIGLGYISLADGNIQLRTKVLINDDEKVLLTQFNELLETHYKDEKLFALCGHNIREFDIPFLCRRMIINDLPLPELLDIADKKPWEIQHIDTFQLWKFGDYKNYTSLELLCAALDLPEWKTMMDGSDIAYVYWEEKNMKKIGEYCLEDVVAVARVYLKYKRLGKLRDDRIVVA